MKYYKLEIIENYLKQNHLSKTKFCNLCKISVKTLEKIYNDDCSIRLKTIRKITKFLGVQPWEIIT